MASSPVAVVTGANSGLGLAVARELTRAGACVVMACRSLDKGRRAVEEVCRVVAEPCVHLEQLDLADLISVRDFAERLSDITVKRTRDGRAMVVIRFTVDFRDERGDLRAECNYTSAYVHRDRARAEARSR